MTTYGDHGVRDSLERKPMTWDPARFSQAERSAAGKAITQAQRVVDRIALRAENDSVRLALGQADDMLAMLYEDLYGAALLGDYPPSIS